MLTLTPTKDSNSWPASCYHCWFEASLILKSIIRSKKGQLQWKCISVTGRDNAVTRIISRRYIDALIIVVIVLWTYTHTLLYLSSNHLQKHWCSYIPTKQQIMADRKSSCHNTKIKKKETNRLSSYSCRSWKIRWIILLSQLYLLVCLRILRKFL